MKGINTSLRALATPEIREKIKELHSKGLAIAEISDTVKVYPKTVGKVIDGTYAPKMHKGPRILKPKEPEIDATALMQKVYDTKLAEIDSLEKQIADLQFKLAEKREDKEFLAAHQYIRVMEGLIPKPDMFSIKK